MFMAQKSALKINKVAVKEFNFESKRIKKKKRIHLKLF